MLLKIRKVLLKWSHWSRKGKEKKKSAIKKKLYIGALICHKKCQQLWKEIRRSLIVATFVNVPRKGHADRSTKRMNQKKKYIYTEGGGTLWSLTKNKIKAPFLVGPRHVCACSAPAHLYPFLKYQRQRRRVNISVIPKIHEELVWGLCHASWSGATKKLSDWKKRTLAFFM